MSDNGGFLARWSRRKRRAVPPRQAAAPPGAAAPPESPPLDPASLPPLDSIGPGTDVRAFLAAGVPPNLTRAALRRAWTSDPAIRDFIGLSENSWDFNAPGSMAGFGSITREEVSRLLDQALGGSADAPQPAAAASSAPTPAPPAPAVPQAVAREAAPPPVEKNNRDGASQHEEIVMHRPTHGGALPE